MTTLRIGRRSPTSTHTCCCRPCTPKSSDARPSWSPRPPTSSGAATASRASRRPAPMVGAADTEAHRRGARLAAMDEQGVDRQWVSVSPNHFYPWAPEGLAVWVAMRDQPARRRARRSGARSAHGSRRRAAAASRAHRGVPRRRRARARAGGRRDLLVRGRCRAVRSRAWSRSGRARLSSAASSSCTRSAAASTSGSTGSTSRTPSGSRPRTRSRCRT